MLRLLIPETQFFDNEKQEFLYLKQQVLTLEHSLSSIYAWESKWKRSFFSKGPSTLEESIDYVKCMTLDDRVDPLVYLTITQQQFDQINEYIDDVKTATTISDLHPDHKRGGVVTAEIVYYWMISLGIPIEWEKRHFNQLLTLIRVTNIKNSPPKKMSKKDAARRMQEINEANKKRFQTKG